MSWTTCGERNSVQRQRPHSSGSTEAGMKQNTYFHVLAYNFKYAGCGFLFKPCLTSSTYPDITHAHKISHSHKARCSNVLQSNRCSSLNLLVNFTKKGPPQPSRCKIYKVQTFDSSSTPLLALFCMYYNINTPFLILTGVEGGSGLF